MFIAMAYYEGESLDKKIPRGPLSIPETLEIGLQVTQALAKAHSKKLVHRDVKPGNIIVTTDGVVKLVDFGLAKLAGLTKLTREGTTLGTMAYMSPEQAQSLVVDRRSDIFSFGAVLYEMMTGQPPFRGDYEAAVVYSILNEDPEPITGLRTGAPMELEKIVDKCLEKQASERYQHADELIVDLQRLQRDLPSGSLKHTVTFAKPPTKNRFILVASALLLLTLLIVGGLHLFKEPGGDIESLAVLPLVNIAGDPEQEYFVEGMTETLIAELSKIRALRVISRTSVMQYKDTRKALSEIAAELGVDAVIEGSVLRSGEQVRITVQLVEANPERHLWAQTYDRELRDILMCRPR